MKHWIITACAALAACSPQGSDGYTFEKESRRIAQRPIAIVTHPNEHAVKKAYAQEPEGRQLADNEHLFAFVVINSTCTIHMIDPAARYRPEEPGHELTHCLYGDFHPNQNDRG